MVRSEKYGEPEKIIDPAWAEDIEGNPVETSFETDGDVLIQKIGKSPNGAVVIADPYIRDVHHNGKKIGQELVFSKDETSAVAMSASYCAGKVRGLGFAGWLTKGACAGAALVAGHATNTGRCFAIRAIGGKYSPNIVFPYATQC